MSDQWVRIAEASNGEQIRFPTKKGGTLTLSFVSCTSLLIMIGSFFDFYKILLPWGNSPH